MNIKDRIEEARNIHKDSMFISSADRLREAILEQAGESLSYNERMRRQDPASLSKVNANADYSL